ncbi:MAG: hypothetical protein KKA05_11875 [Alphaproteobacteria bacterium]|nr:hypothetical protein [Alphaproteobacteria bacterium]
MRVREMMAILAEQDPEAEVGFNYDCMDVPIDKLCEGEREAVVFRMMGRLSGSPYEFPTIVDKGAGPPDRSRFIEEVGERRPAVVFS